MWKPKISVWTQTQATTYTGRTCVFIAQMHRRSAFCDRNFVTKKLWMGSVAMWRVCWWGAWYRLERAVWLAEPSESFASAAKQSSGHCCEDSELKCIKHRLCRVSCCSTNVWLCFVRRLQCNALQHSACCTTTCNCDAAGDTLCNLYMLLVLCGVLFRSKVGP